MTYQSSKPQMTDMSFNLSPTTPIVRSSQKVKLRMSSTLSLKLNALTHQDDAVHGIATTKKLVDAQRHVAPAKPVESNTVPERAFQLDNIALSFAYDTAAKSLNIVMTNKNSGEVVRKISYKQIPSEVHRTHQLHGLLLDRMV